MNTNQTPAIPVYEPDELYVIDDNVEAIRLIVDQGILDLLKPSPGGQFAAHCYETEHHWCMASYHCGHAEETDNGYSVCMAPKSKHSADYAAEMFAHCIHETTVGITYGYKKRCDMKTN